MRTVGTVADYQVLKQKVGIDRSVVVAAASYGFDNSCLLEALDRFGADARGVAMVDPETAPAELKTLDARGVRGARFYLEKGTRVADKLLVIDLPRPPAPLHLLRLASMLPLAPFVPFVHDGVISSLRSYSPSALRALADHVDADAELRGGLLSPQIMVATQR